MALKVDVRLGMMPGDHMRETERKFRLANRPDPSILGPGVPIAQGYLITQGGEERIRRKGDRCFWTVKGEGDLTRDEFEVEVPEWVFSLLWPHTEDRRIEKTRHMVTWDGFALEVDVYHGALAGLVILECEFRDQDAALSFRLPEWAAEAREVTWDERYKNRNLCLAGLPDHPDAATRP